MILYNSITNYTTVQSAMTNSNTVFGNDTRYNTISHFLHSIQFNDEHHIVIQYRYLDINTTLETIIPNYYTKFWRIIMAQYLTIGLQLYYNMIYIAYTIEPQHTMNLIYHIFIILYNIILNYATVQSTMIYYYIIHHITLFLTIQQQSIQFNAILKKLRRSIDDFALPIHCRYIKPTYDVLQHIVPRVSIIF